MYLTAWSETQYSVFSFVVSHNHKTTHAHTLINIWKIHGKADHLSVVVEPFVCFDMSTFCSETEVNSEVTSAVFRRISSWCPEIFHWELNLLRSELMQVQIFQSFNIKNPFLLDCFPSDNPSAPPPHPLTPTFKSSATSAQSISQPESLNRHRWG